MRIAIMQPYFLPYAGYFRLFAAADLFVIYDCVQFPRRGWLHRNQFRHMSGELEWLTLPLVKAPQEVRIDALTLDAARQQEWREALQKFPCFGAPALQRTGLAAQIETLEGSAESYISGLLERVCSVLDLPFRVERSSAAKIPAELRGQERILALCRHYGATEYINSPGGRELYTPEAFREAGVSLRFLEPYQGAGGSIAQQLADATSADIKQGLNRQLRLTE